MSEKPTMPSEVSQHVGFFDRFAEGASRLASRAWFFCFCVILVVVWAPSILVLHSIDTWQLIINTVTTIVTFLMVALLQNSQTRTDQALQHKLNAIADALSDMMDKDHPQDAKELREAVGLEERESTSNNAAKESSASN
jgi:low affinity Fe/Cu permease